MGGKMDRRTNGVVEMRDGLEDGQSYEWGWR